MKEPALQPPIAPEANDALEKIRQFIEFSAVCEEKLANLLEKAGIAIDKDTPNKLRGLTWIESEHRFTTGRPGAVAAARCTDGHKDVWTVVRKQFREEEWLGYQLDRVFNARRHPATVMRDVGGLPSSMSELLEGQNGMMFDWSKEASDAEVARLADYHYLIGEMDGNDSNVMKTAGGKLMNFDRGFAFTDNNKWISSMPVARAVERKLPADPDILQAVEKYRASAELQTTVREAFEKSFTKDGLVRFEAMNERIDRYLKNRGIPADVLPKWKK